MNSTEELLDAVRESVKGVTGKCDRQYFLRLVETGEAPTAMWEAMAGQGLLALGVPEELGGSGGGISAPTAVMESMSAAGVPPMLYALTVFSREAILKHGTAQQIADHVVPSMHARRKICFGVTEPDAGTNSFAMSTRAERQDDGSYLISGQKTFISGADHADHILLAARTAPAGEPTGRRSGISLFIVDLSSPGIDLHRLNIKWYASEKQFTVFFKDLLVPPEALIGTEGHGMSYLFDSLNAERIMVAAWGLGLGYFALAKGVAYAKVRAPFGRPIGAYQAVQHPLARARAHLDAAQRMMYHAADVYDRGGDAGAPANMAKMLGSEAACEAVDAALQTYGGHGFVEDNDVVTLYPMTRVMRVAPVNNEMILNYIGQRLLGLPRSY